MFAAAEQRLRRRRDTSMLSTVAYTVKREFKARAHNLHHDKPDAFCKSQWSGWRGCASLYVAYRWAVACYLLAGLLVSLVDVRTLGQLPWPENAVFRLKWAIYVTNWTALVLTAQALLAAALATQHYRNRRSDLNNEPQTMSKLHKSYWLLNNLGNVLSPAVTLLYWSTVYNPNIFRLDFVNAHNHIVNSVVVVVDLAVCGHPVRLLHLYQPMLLAAVYALFTSVYYACGGTNRQGEARIYPLLEWRRPGVALAAVCAACLLLVVLHALVWLFYLLRRRVALGLVPPPAPSTLYAAPHSDAPTTDAEREHLQLC